MNIVVKLGKTKLSCFFLLTLFIGLIINYFVVAFTDAIPPTHN